ncbi:MAG: multifunctional CCA addition/repair protein [Gammaproteobacteria bacterium]|nr:MAG: multifunctional CCA addition/repair protein [Gammaproteobacteria bacterium]
MMDAYLVGGAVRDECLGLPVKERDYVVVGATPNEMIAHGFKPVGADFPVFLHPESKAEYALARTERKTAPGYRGFVFHTDPAVTLEEDLKRRDLTINAMARRANGSLVDPYGGQADIERRLLRHVSTAFVEDPVRILRVARFAARFVHLGFTVAPETQALMQQMVADGEVNALVPERVWSELSKGLLEPSPQEFFSVLKACGALAVLFPEIERLYGVPQPANYHPEIDCGIHTLMVLEQAALLTTDPVIRFAALVHDLGKGTTPTNILPRHHGHEARSVELINALCDRYKAPREYRELAVVTARWHSHVHKVRELKPSTLLDALEGADAFRRPDRFEQFLIVCEADARGREGLEREPYLQAQMMRDALKKANSVDAASIANESSSGASIKERLRQARIEALSQPAIKQTD